MIFDGKSPSTRVSTPRCNGRGPQGLVVNCRPQRLLSTRSTTKGHSSPGNSMSTQVGKCDAGSTLKRQAGELMMTAGWHCRLHRESHGTRDKPPERAKCAPRILAGKNWEPFRLTSRNRDAYIPSIRRLQLQRGGQQKDFADQGERPVKNRAVSRRQPKTPDRLYGSLKAVDPVTGEVKGQGARRYPNISGALAPPAIGVFIGHPTGHADGP